MANLSNIDNKFLVTTGGNIGIGDTGPTRSLSILRSEAVVNVKSSGVSGHSMIILDHASSANNYSQVRFSNAGSAKFAIGIDPQDSYKLKIVNDGNATGANTRMTITTGGNVGIGTASPQVSLQIGTHLTTAPADTGLCVSNRKSIRINDADGSYNFGVYIKQNYSGSSYLILGTRHNGTDTDGLVVKSGNVGIATTVPAFELQIGGTDVSGTGSFSAQFAVLSEATTGYPSGFIFKAPRVATSSNRVLLNEDFGTYFSTQVYATSTAGAQSDIPIVFAPLGGNVGIGTASPSEILHIKDSTNTTLNIEGDSAAGSTFINFTAGSNATKAQISGAKAGVSGGRLLVYTANSSGTSTERMRIDSSGNVGIGVTPIRKFDVNGTSTFYDNVYITSSKQIQWEGGNYWTWRVSGTEFQMYRGDTAATPFTVNTSNNATFAGNITATTATNTNIQSVSTGDWAAMQIQCSDAASAYLFFNDTSAERARIQSTASNDLKFSTNGGGSLALTLDSSTNATFAGNVKLTDEKILGLRNATNDYALQYRDLDFRLIGSADGTTQRKFSFGYYTSDNPAGTWNGKVYINSYTGDVGIGTTSPDYKLDIEGTSPRIRVKETSSNTSSTMVEVENSDGRGAMLGVGGSGRSDILTNRGFINAQTELDGLAIGTEGTDPIIFYTQGVSTSNERMRITSSGNVGIGLTTPTGNLSMNSQIYLGTTPPSTYTTNTSATRYQSFFNSGYGVTSDGVGPYPRYFDMVATGSPDGFNGGSNLRFFTTGVIAATGAELRMTINSAGKVGIGIAAPTQKLDVNGIVKHLGLDMSAGIQVDQTTAYTKTLTGTSGTWRPTGIDGTDLASTGSYLVQVYSNDHSGVGPANYSWYWTGTMSWYASATNNNVTSEIYLNGCGHHTNLTFELRTKVNYNSAAIPYPELEWKSNTSFVDSPNWLFTFRRLL
jgi:hypothetical protein